MTISTSQLTSAWLLRLIDRFYHFQLRHQSPFVGVSHESKSSPSSDTTVLNHSHKPLNDTDERNESLGWTAKVISATNSRPRIYPRPLPPPPPLSSLPPPPTTCTDTTDSASNASVLVSSGLPYTPHIDLNEVAAAQCQFAKVMQEIHIFQRSTEATTSIIIIKQWSSHDHQHRSMLIIHPFFSVSLSISLSLSLSFSIVCTDAILSSDVMRQSHTLRLNEWHHSMLSATTICDCIEFNAVHHGGWFK